ncbi:hypothetical protein, partial [Nocardia abscessus]|uniref:hypothetical protein n=1 Tax=Nocardia abscessus TaxID=120957 RepID=UPI00245742BB
MAAGFARRVAVSARACRRRRGYRRDRRTRPCCPNCGWERRWPGSRRTHAVHLETYNELELVAKWNAYA